MMASAAFAVLNLSPQERGEVGLRSNPGEGHGTGQTAAAAFAEIHGPTGLIPDILDRADA
jgi:hypothetical protein